MGNYSPTLTKKLNAIAHAYRDLMFRSIQEVLQQYSNTGKGLQSLIVNIVDGTEDKAPQIKIDFDDELIYLNLGKMNWTKLPQMDRLLKWAETKQSDPKKAKQLAWATAWDKKKHDTWKRRPWRKKSLSTVLKEMNELIVAVYNKAIEEDAVEASLTV